MKDESREEPYGTIELVNGKIDYPASSNLRGSSLSRKPAPILALTFVSATIGNQDFRNKSFKLKFENTDDSVEWMQSIALQIGNAEDYEKKLPPMSGRVSKLLEHLDRDEVEEILVELLNQKKISWKCLKSMVD